jgi:hypothetical protein
MKIVMCNNNVWNRNSNKWNDNGNNSKVVAIMINSQ